MLSWIAAIILFFSGSVTDADAVKNGEQIGVANEILTTGNGDACTAYVQEKTYTMYDEDCDNAETGYLVYKYEGENWLISPITVTENGGVIPGEQ